MTAPEEKKVNVCLLILTKEMIGTIGNGLMELPTKEGMPVVLNINEQIKTMVENLPEFVAGVERLIAPLKAKLEAEKEKG